MEISTKYNCTGLVNKYSEYFEESILLKVKRKMICIERLLFLSYIKKSVKGLITIDR